MSSREDWWYDEAAGPLVRPYAMVRGRTRPVTRELHLVTQVRAARQTQTADLTSLNVEHRELLEVCRKPLSVAEVAAYLDVPLIVVKVLLSDLIERGDVIVQDVSRISEIPDRDLLQAVLDGVRGI
ncbi:DUF742 domain-containing protein [Lentzea tibetensis]|uniref:DUF742 domain-containing protein n=1 Tax=Lentzea tibetensis TaxID=2591470 RepID=A0A563EVS7_9PSEU|nr:DUF742 domain-containing protein [Lentzea tibetensis]TWP51805.1 DUF742 domain-containing protein [Lentzea tibetensis]